MDFGVSMPTMMPGVDRDLVYRWAEVAESGPLTSINAGERLAYASYDPMLTLTAAASVTSRVRLISNVLCLPLHSPGIVAKQAASLDHFSSGRFVLGIGVGAERLDEFYLAG